MKLGDKLIVKHKDTIIEERIYLASTQTQYLFARQSEIVGSDGKAVLWASEAIGAIAFLPIKKKHNYVQTSEDVWELDVEPIDKDDL